MTSVLLQASKRVSTYSARFLRPSSFYLGSQLRHHNNTVVYDGTGEYINVTWVASNGVEETIKAPLGTRLNELKLPEGMELESACEGSLACSTCHVILEPEFYDKLEEPCEDEEDMLDLATELTETSRLGCQIICAKELDGMRVRIPHFQRNICFEVPEHKAHEIKQVIPEDGTGKKST